VDIFGYPIYAERPSSIRQEIFLKAGNQARILFDIPDCREADDFELFLNLVRFGNRQIKSYSTNVTKIHVEKPKVIYTYLNILNYEDFASFYGNRTGLKKNGYYLFSDNGEAFWDCAFCGTANSTALKECKCCSSTLEEQKYYEKEEVQKGYQDWLEACNQQKQAERERAKKEKAKEEKAKEEKAKEERAEKAKAKEEERRRIQEKKDAENTRKFFNWFVIPSILIATLYGLTNVLRSYISVWRYIKWSLLISFVLSVIIACVNADDNLDYSGIIVFVMTFIILIISVIIYGIIVY
jgi:hypothetical protein